LTQGSGRPGGPPPGDEALSPAAPATAAAERWSGHERACDLTVRPSDGGVVVGDSRLLAQAIDNLLDNALRHTPTGTPVRLLAERRAGSTVLAVEDDGPGIDSGDLTGLFRPFHRGRPARAIPGAGLGLTVARRIIEAHCGTLDLVPRRSPAAASRSCCLPPTIVAEPTGLQVLRLPGPQGVRPSVRLQKGSSRASVESLLGK